MSRAHFPSRITALSLMAVVMLAACNSERDTATPERASQAIPSPTLVTVNGEAITQADVDFMIERTFSGAEQLFVDQQAQSKVVESLIATRAMKQVMLTELPVEELSDIEQKTKAYQEELYVKAYLVEHATPQPVSTAMVENYYKANLQEFGGGEQKSFEMLRAQNQPSESQRDAIFAAFNQAKSSNDWSQFAASNADKLSLNYTQSVMRPGLLDASLETALRGLSKGQISEVLLVKGMPHLVRVSEVQTLPAKPLASVSADIRKKLAAQQLRKAIKKASDDVIQNAEIEYRTND